MVMSVIPTAISAAVMHQTPTSSNRSEAARENALIPGTTAIINADGSCLRLRDAPEGNRLDCFADGSVVEVLQGAEIKGDYRWQYVSIDGRNGWMADEFLQPSPSVPSCGTSAINAGFSSSLPNNGISIQSWGGGTLSGIINTALADGCNATSFFVTVDGEWMGYRPNAPTFVNQAWFDYFGGEQVSAGTLMMMFCGTSSNQNTLAMARYPFLPAPIPTGSAPILTTGIRAAEVNSSAAIVIDEASGAVLYEQNAHDALAPASLTKIATAILAIEGTDLEAWVGSDVDSRTMYGSSVMGLHPGDCFQMRDLIRGLMLRSGNDAALAIGRYQAGSDEAFVHQMNTLLLRLGLTDSHFSNAHGLDSDNHHMSAYDLGMLARYGMQLEEFRDAVSSSVWTADGNRELTMYNINSFIYSYSGADGIKTGYTEGAGRTFVGSATRNGKRVYVVLLNSANYSREGTSLLNWAFDNHSWD